MLSKCCVIISLSIAGLFAGATTQAQTPALSVQAGLPPSLQFASDDASFYYALTNNRLKWDAMVANPAIQRLIAMPVVRRAIADAREEIAANIQKDLAKEESPPSLRSMIEFWFSAEGQAYLPTLADLASGELFVFAGKGFAEQLAAYNTAVFAQLSELDLDRESGFEGIDDSTDAAWSEGLLSNLRVPRVVAGAKLSGPPAQQRVRELLNMLEAKFRNELLNLSDAENTYILDSLVHQGAGEKDEQWVLHLKGDDYPWDAAIERLQADVDPEKAAEIEERFTNVRERVAGKSLVLCIGFADGYVFASMGHDPDAVAPSKAEQPLYRRGVFKPLLKNRSKTFSGISYQNSKHKQQTSWVTRMSVYLRIIPNIAKSALSGTAMEPESYAPLLADIEQDSEMLLADLNRLYNPAGDQLAFSFFFNGGVAGYNYHRHTDPISVQAQPLKSLEHVGEHPAMFHAKAEWEDDGTRNKWLNRIQQRAAQIMDLYAESPDAPSAEALASVMTAGLAELFRATKDDLLPSLGHESAFVLDFEQRSQQWHPAMPPAQVDLPVPAAALVYDLADAEQHLRAWRRYFDTINPLLAPFGPMMGLPQGQGLPAAREAVIPGGMYLQLPGVEALGVDPRFSPGLAITDEWAVYTLFQRQGVDLIEPHSPQFPPPLSDISRPLIAAGHVDFLQFADAAQAWLDYATPLIKQSELYQEQPKRDPDARKSPDIDETIELFTAAIDLLRQVTSYTHATYVQDNAVVTQSVIKIPTLHLPPANSN